MAHENLLHNTPPTQAALKATESVEPATLYESRTKSRWSVINPPLLRPYKAPCTPNKATKKAIAAARSVEPCTSRPVPSYRAPGPGSPVPGPEKSLPPVPETPVMSAPYRATCQSTPSDPPILSGVIDTCGVGPHMPHAGTSRDETIRQLHIQNKNNSRVSLHRRCTWL